MCPKILLCMFYIITIFCNVKKIDKLLLNSIKSDNKVSEKTISLRALRAL